MKLILIRALVLIKDMMYFYPYHFNLLFFLDNDSIILWRQAIE